MYKHLFCLSTHITSQNHVEDHIKNMLDVIFEAGDFQWANGGKYVVNV